jgi:formylglycine-generating enzyme required for sulfatase activity
MMRQAARFHAVRGLALLFGLAAITALGLGARSQVIEQQNAEHASGLVHRLLDADTAQVPDIIKELEAYRRWADPLLRQANEGAKDGSRQQLHTSLALLPVDEGQVESLYQRLLKAGPQELPMIRDALAGHRDRLVGRLWDVLGDAGSAPDQRYRAACALATYDPAGGDEGRQGWAAVAPFVADRLLLAVQQNPSHFTALRETLRPVRDALIVPLSSAYRNRQRGESERSWATSFLADYAADQPQVLADLLLDADEKQFAVIYAKLQAHGDRALPVLTGEVDKKLPAEAKDEAKERLAKRQANAAVALLRMNHPEKVWPLLKHSPDPRVRSYLIHRLGLLGADAGVLVKRLGEEPEVTVRRALILSLGPEEFGEGAWTPEGKKQFVRQLQEVYRTAADPGLHAAAEWLLRQWQEGAWLAQTDEAWAKDGEQREKRLEGIRQGLAGEKGKAPPQWYVNGQGQTMVVVPGPVEFLMGSPPTEAGRSGNEGQHRERIGRTFALAAKPVTVKQYREFSKGYGVNKQYAPTEDCPVPGTDWYMAASYCNWLSGREGLPRDQWCYETDVLGRVTKLQENYLSLTGYRLPTEAEVEYATRAGAVTSRYYGETEELLEKYGWYVKNSKERSWPVGSKKPNDLGLFDLHGNVYTWCQERYQDYPTSKEGEVIDDKKDSLGIISTDSRVLRGGSFNLQASDVRCAYRDRNVPTDRFNVVGFRPARTFTP